MIIVSTTVGKNPLEEISSPHSQQKSPKCNTWVQSLKWQNDLCFQGKPFNIKVIQVYGKSTSNAEEAEVEQFYEDLQGLLELTPKKDVLYIIGDWNAKVGSQEIPGVTGKFGLGVAKWSRAKANRVFPREHTGHSKHSLSKTQEKTLHMDITWWSIEKSDWLLYSLQPKMEKLYTVSKNKMENWLWPRLWILYCQIQTYIEERRENY